MKYIATYNDEGFYTGLYPTDIWNEEDIPAGNKIELTKEQWLEASSKKCKIIDGVHTIVEKTEAEIIELALNSVRNNRDKLLLESDWTQLQDAPLTEEQRQAWAVYRQSLRDLPATVDINNIVYPEKP